MNREQKYKIYTLYSILETGFFIMFGVRVTSTSSAGDRLNIDMQDMQFYVGGFQLNVSSRLDGRLYHVEVWTCRLHLVVCPPELRENFLAPHQEQQRSNEAQADVENEEVGEGQQEKQLLVGQEGVEVSFE